MPTAMATMPPLADRRVEHASFAELFLQSLGDAEDAAEIADILAKHDDVVVALPSSPCGRSLSAWIMFRSSLARLVQSRPARAARVGARGLRHRRPRTSSRRLPCLVRGRIPALRPASERRGRLASHSAVSAACRSLVPFAERDQMRLQPFDRIAERPRLRLVRRAIAGRVVRGRMALRAISEELDERWPEVRPGALRRPFAPRHRRPARHCRRPAGPATP